MVALDTNVLVSAHRREFAQHEAAHALLAEVTQVDLAFGVQGVVTGEFLRVATHPRILDPPTSRVDALAVINGVLASPRARILGPVDPYWQVLRTFVDGLRLSGNAMFDAQIAALCLVNGFSTIVTSVGSTDWTSGPSRPRGRGRFGTALAASRTATRRTGQPGPVETGRPRRRVLSLTARRWDVADASRPEFLTRDTFDLRRPLL